MIDMEEGVVNEILKGPLRDVFDCQQLITDVSGSGNNWYIYCPMFVHACLWPAGINKCFHSQQGCY